VELPGAAEEMDDAAFAQLRSRWPLGHLAYVFGLKREDLLRLPRASSSAVLSLDSLDAEARLEELLPSPQLSRVTPDAA
jgi:hypothetical protein